jgi:hypothetical protein
MMSKVDKERFATDLMTCDGHSDHHSELEEPVG